MDSFIHILQIWIVPYIIYMENTFTILFLFDIIIMTMSVIIIVSIIISIMSLIHWCN